MNSIQCISLGLFILDSFEYLDAEGNLLETQKLKVQLGGGGLYAMIGSRIHLPASSVGLLIDRGSDWDETLQVRLDSFGEEMWNYREVDRLTTRAVNRYKGEVREFLYLGDKTPLEPQDLPTSFRSAKYLHFVCSPTRAKVILSQLKSLDLNPKLVYEPIDNSCIFENLDELIEILPSIDYFSPNHIEAALLLHDEMNHQQAELRGKLGIEEDARRFKELGSKNIIIRSGRLGAFILSKEGNEKWIPAFHQTQDFVVDCTGGGNSFLGGFMAGLTLEKENLELAGTYGSVSSSFIIEQFGLPSVNLENGKWNGVDPKERVEELRKRVGL